MKTANSRLSGPILDDISVAGSRHLSPNSGRDPERVKERYRVGTHNRTAKVGDAER